jgi:hypothetical protein
MAPKKAAAQARVQHGGDEEEFVHSYDHCWKLLQYTGVGIKGLPQDCQDKYMRDDKLVEPANAVKINVVNAARPRALQGPSEEDLATFHRVTGESGNASKAGGGKTTKRTAAQGRNGAKNAGGRVPKK